MALAALPNPVGVFHRHKPGAEDWVFEDDYVFLKPDGTVELKWEQTLTAADPTTWDGTLRITKALSPSMAWASLSKCQRAMTNLMLVCVMHAFLSP